MKYDVIVLGGGASGLMSAIVCAERGKKVAVIDRNFTMGKKLMVTGNGRCNMTNIHMNSDKYNVNIDKYLSRFNELNTIMFFKNLGLAMSVDDEGRVYPITNNAKSVIDVLNNRLDELQVDKIFNTEVVDVEQIIDGYSVICADNKKYTSRKLIVATGGNTLVNFAKELRESVVENRPSLCALKTTKVQGLNNIKLSNVKVTAFPKYGVVCGKDVKSIDNNNAVFDKKYNLLYLKCSNKNTCILDDYLENNSICEYGEVLFKDGGVSGISIFNVSAYFARSGYEGKIIIDIFPSISAENLFNIMCEARDKNRSLLKGLVVDALANNIYARCGIDDIKVSKNISDKKIKEIAYVLKHMDFDVTNAYDNNQVFSGGIKLDSINCDLSSKMSPGLYWVGEIVDVDGVCGGYNLQWAWTSGYIAGMSV